MLVILATVQSITDKEIIQLALNGAFEENKLPDPETILPCIDDVSAHKIVVFAGQFLDKAGKGSLQDLLSLPQLVKDFGNSLDPKVGQCLNGNAEFQALGDKYNLNNKTGDEIEKKVIQYITLHYLTVHKWMAELDGLWKKASYYQTGFNAAGYAHNIFKLSKLDAILSSLHKWQNGDKQGALKGLLSEWKDGNILKAFLDQIK